MRTITERGTDDLLRAIVGLMMLAGILVLHLILNLLSGPIEEPFGRMILWTFLGAMAVIAFRIVWLAIIGRALKPIVDESIGETSDRV